MIERPGDGVDRPDPEKMSYERLRDEYSDINERHLHGVADAADDARLGDRLDELWNEMTGRIDAEPPACPECGSSRWTQSIGEPKYCNGCGLALGYNQADLIAEIDAYWEAVFAGPTEDGSDD